MKKQNIGLSISMLGIILALGQGTAAYLVGVTVGIAGLIVVIAGSKEE